MGRLARAWRLPTRKDAPKTTWPERGKQSDVSVQQGDLQGVGAEDSRAVVGRAGCGKPRSGAARVRGGDHAAGDRSPLLRAAGADALLRHPLVLPDVGANAG